METQSQIQKLRRLVWFGGAASFITVVVAVSASWLLYQYTIDLLTENLRARLLTISTTQAANMDAEAIKALQTEADWHKPEWARVVNRLRRVKDENSDIVYMYIFRKSPEDPTKMEFVADAGSINPYANLDDDPSNDVDANGDGTIEPEGADTLQWPGQPYEEAVDIPETYAAYNGPLTGEELYEDTYGQVLSGYAPIKDAEGNVVGILATDIKADDFFAVTRQTLLPFLMFISFLILIILVLAGVLIYLWERRAESLATLDRLKSEFLSVATHQLRAPLTAIRGYSANIIEGTYGEVPEHIAQPLRVIRESTRLMGNAIEDYLNISRIDQGRMKYEKSIFDISDVAMKVTNELKPIADEKGLKLLFSTSGPLKVNADIGKMKQVVTNLVDNAIKYTNAGTVSVSAELHAGMARIIVADTGVGISEEDIQKLFSKFTRARDANKVNTTGTGLGLYVAKQLTEGNGGKVWVESDGVGKGSRFIVELPV